MTWKGWYTVKQNNQPTSILFWKTITWLVQAMMFKKYGTSRRYNGLNRKKRGKEKERKEIKRKEKEEREGKEKKTDIPYVNKLIGINH